MMTLRQIEDVYFHPRDEHGVIIRTAPWAKDTGQHRSYEEDFRGIWKERGATDEQLDALWAKFLEQEGQKQFLQVQQGIMGAEGTVFSVERHEEFEQSWKPQWIKAVNKILGISDKEEFVG